MRATGLQDTWPEAFNEGGLQPTDSGWPWWAEAERRPPPPTYCLHADGDIRGAHGAPYG